MRWLYAVLVHHLLARGRRGDNKDLNAIALELTNEADAIGIAWIAAELLLEVQARLNDIERPSDDCRRFGCVETNLIQAVCQLIHQVQIAAALPLSRIQKAWQGSFGPDL